MPLKGRDSKTLENSPFGRLSRFFSTPPFAKGAQEGIFKRSFHYIWVNPFVNRSTFVILALTCPPSIGTGLLGKSTIPGSYPKDGSIEIFNVSVGNKYREPMGRGAFHSIW
jgi:hypothetical protein